MTPTPNNRRQTKNVEAPPASTFKLSSSVVAAIKAMPGSQDLYDLARSLLELHARKNADYADDHPLSNFIWTAAYAGVTPRQALKVLCGKQQAARLSIEKHGYTITDSLRERKQDVIVYHMLELALEDSLHHLIDEVIVFVPTVDKGTLVQKYLTGLFDSGREY